MLLTKTENPIHHTNKQKVLRFVVVYRIFAKNSKYFTTDICVSLSNRVNSKSKNTADWW